jgi:hypothetical protein
MVLQPPEQPIDLPGPQVFLLSAGQRIETAFCKIDGYSKQDDDQEQDVHSEDQQIGRAESYREAP